MNSNKSSVCVFGLGYVGLTLAVTLAAKGHRVHGVEVSERILECLRRDTAHFHEPKLNELIALVIKRGLFSFSRVFPANERFEEYIITIGTPLDREDVVDLSMIDRVTVDLASIIDRDSLVVLRSTVRVGTTRKIQQKFLSLCGYSPHLAFCPERTAEGVAMEELLHLPQVIGGIDHTSTKRASALFSSLTQTTIEVSSPECAEMIKLVDNVSRDSIFALANEFAIACDELALSANEVITSGARGYKRAVLPLPGPVGGPCLEKDTYIYSQSFNGFRPRIAEAGRATNESIVEHAIKFIGRTVGPKAVAVLGLAFKGEPATSDLRGSQSIDLIRSVRRHFGNIPVTGYDEFVNPNDVVSQGLDIKIAESIDVAIATTDVVFIMNRTYEFSNYDFTPYLDRPGTLIYDFWGQQSALYADRGNYIAFGSHAKRKI